MFSEHTIYTIAMQAKTLQNIFIHKNEPINSFF